MEPERLDQSGIERDAVGAELLPQRPFRPRLLQQALQHPRETEALLPLRRISTRRRDRDA
jgi:hypothetical protein